MSNDSKHEAAPGNPIVYQIRTQGYLDAQWTDRFAGMTITPEENGDTLLTGPVVDQAALFGLLKKVRDLGLPLVSINRVEPCPEHGRGAGKPGIEEIGNSTNWLKKRNEERGERMKAIVYTHYGPPDVLQLMDIPKPEPTDNQILVKVRAASINALDYRRFEKISFMGRLMEERLIKSVGKPLGADIAGVVEAVGANIKQFKPGDEVSCFH